MTSTDNHPLCASCGVSLGTEHLDNGCFYGLRSFPSASVGGSAKFPVGTRVRVIGTSLTGIVTRSKAIHDVRLDDYTDYSNPVSDEWRMAGFHRNELVRIGRLDGVGTDMEVPIDYREYDECVYPVYHSALHLTEA